jgi:hypothetical protein
MRGSRTALLAGVSAAAGLAARYAAGRARVDRSWRQHTASRLAGVGEAARMSILPLVERLSPDSGLRGEPGIAYLVHTPNTTLLFDCGLGTGSLTSALAANSTALGVALARLDGRLRPVPDPGRDAMAPCATRGPSGSSAWATTSMSDPCTGAAADGFPAPSAPPRPHPSRRRRQRRHFADTDPDRNDQIDAAYRDKYRRYGERIIGGVVNPEPRRSSSCRADPARRSTTTTEDGIRPPRPVRVTAPRGPERRHPPTFKSARQITVLAGTRPPV